MKKLFIILLLLLLLLPIITYAGEPKPVPIDNNNNKPAATADPLDDPLGNQGSLAAAGNNLIKGVMGIVGVLAIIAFIWGGIEWMISGGNPERIKKGKTMMIWAVWGLVVIFGSYAILDIVFKALGA